jgi:hypothetical protein
MLINKKGNELLNANLSFFSRQINDNAVEIEKGIIIQPSGIPLLLEQASTKKQNSEDNLYLNFISDPLNGSVTGCSVIKKSEFKFQDRSFHYPVLIRKNKKNEGINSDIAHYQPSYGNVNVQIIEELVDDPQRFIVKISEIDNLYDSNEDSFVNNGERKSYVQNYVKVGQGIKILGVTIGNYLFEDSLTLISAHEQEKIDFKTTSYFIPLAIIDTDKKDFTILH